MKRQKTVTVEPGVTQGQLYEYMQQHKFDFMVPTTGAGPNCSLIGNALERGYGLTPHGDHFGAMQALEAVLPNGDVYKSVHSSLGADEISKRYKWGIGPYIDGLFAQSNIGIVTQMTIALVPRPEEIEVFIFKIDPSKLSILIKKISTLLSMLGHNVSGINVMNHKRLLAILGLPCPEDFYKPDGIIDPIALNKFARKNGIAEWNGFGALYGSKKIVKECRKIIKAQLKDSVYQLHFVTYKKVDFLRKIMNFLPFNKLLLRKINNLLGAMDIIHGKPNDMSLKLVYWKSKNFQNLYNNLEPDKNRAGLIWFAPLVPMKANAVQIFIEIVERICAQYGIEPLITMTTISERCFDCTIPILFDFNDPVYTKRAEECHKALFDAAKKEGFIPYRIDINSMDKIINPNDPFWKVVASIKNAIDPNHIIAPRRYEPGQVILK